MDNSTSQGSFRDTIRLISTIISWTIFTILVICVIFLSYCFISTKIYAVKGEKYEPKISLYTIVSPSMTPNINVYDVIVNLKVDKPEDIKINDVITFISTNPETAGMTITHRVISIMKDTDGNYSFQTKGDFALVEDSGTVPFSNIIGRVAFRIPKLGRVQFFLAEKMHWLLVILIPALYIIVRGILQRLTKGKEFKKYHLFRIGTKNKLLFLPFRKGNIVDENSELINIGENPFINNDIEPKNEELNIEETKEELQPEVKEVVQETVEEEKPLVKEQPVENNSVFKTNKVEDNSSAVVVNDNNEDIEFDLPDLKQ